MSLPRKLCKRFDDPGHAHALTFSCHQGLPLLSRDRTRRWLIESIDVARKLAQFEVWAYVIMPEHVHILVHPLSTEPGISQILWQIKRPVARKAISYLKSKSPGWLNRLTIVNSDGRRMVRFWQAGGGYDRNVIEPETAEKIRKYFHMNPVRRGLVEKPEDWEWSSVRWYAGLRPTPLEMDATFPHTYQD